MRYPGSFVMQLGTIVHALKYGHNHYYPNTKTNTNANTNHKNKLNLSPKNLDNCSD